MNKDKDSMKRCRYCDGRSYSEKPFKVITHLGNTVYVRFNFCPYCGTRMKEVNEK